MHNFLQTIINYGTNKLLRVYFYLQFLIFTANCLCTFITRVKNNKHFLTLITKFISYNIFILYNQILIVL